MRAFRRMSTRISLAHCSRAAVLCALSLCAMPHNAYAQQTQSIPVLGDLPLIGRLYTTPPVAKAPVLSDLPRIRRLYRVEWKTPAQPKVAGAQDSSGQIVSIEARSATLGQVIELLMDQAHLSYTLDAGLEKVPVGSLKLRKVPFDIALRTILKSASGRATYIREDGIYRILPQEILDVERQTPGMPQPSGEPVGKATVEILNPALPGEDVKINLDVNNTNLYEALNLIFMKNKINYTLEPALRNFPITAHLNAVTLRDALELLLKSVNSPVPLTYRVENGVYKIVAKTQDNTEGAKP